MLPCRESACLVCRKGLGSVFSTEYTRCSGTTPGESGGRRIGSSRSSLTTRELEVSVGCVGQLIHRKIDAQKPRRASPGHLDLNPDLEAEWLNLWADSLGGPQSLHLSDSGHKPHFPGL